MIAFQKVSDNTVFINDLKGLPSLPCNENIVLVPDQHMPASSSGSVTPLSPLLTPRTSQIELLLSGKSTITEHENFQQVIFFLRKRYIFPVKIEDL